jgi:UDP-glucuronate decarboxylase
MHPGDGRVVSNFIMQALRNEEITIYGDGSQTRSFCYVDDLIEGLLRTMASREAFTGPVNMGSPAEMSIKTLAEKITELTGSRSTIRYRARPEDDPLQRQPDISLAREELGWEPTVPLEQGLTTTIASFVELLRQQSTR